MSQSYLTVFSASHILKMLQAKRRLGQYNFSDMGTTKYISIVLRRQIEGNTRFGGEFSVVRGEDCILQALRLPPMVGTLQLAFPVLIGKKMKRKKETVS